jgi:hypothetical protein
VRVRRSDAAGQRRLADLFTRECLALRDTDVEGGAPAALDARVHPRPVVSFHATVRRILGWYRFDPERLGATREAAVSYVVGAARKVALKGARRAAPARLHLVPDLPPASPDDDRAARVREVCEVAREYLSAVDLEILSRRGDGESHAEIGAALRLTPHACELRASRARQRVRAAIPRPQRFLGTTCVELSTRRRCRLASRSITRCGTRRTSSARGPPECGDTPGPRAEDRLTCNHRVS